jgi:hypothetical protein
MKLEPRNDLVSVVPLKEKKELVATSEAMHIDQHDQQEPNVTSVKQQDDSDGVKKSITLDQKNNVMNVVTLEKTKESVSTLDAMHIGQPDIPEAKNEDSSFLSIGGIQDAELEAYLHEGTDESTIDVTQFSDLIKFNSSVTTENNTILCGTNG